MDISGLTLRELAIYSFVLNVCIAIFFALITLLLGFKKGRTKIALWGCLAIIVGGAIVGIYASIPLFIIFLWLIFKKPAVVPADEPAVEESAETTDESS